MFNLDTFLLFIKLWGTPRHPALQRKENLKSGKCQALHTIPIYLLAKPGSPSPDNHWKDTVTQSYDEWLEKENIIHPKEYPFKYGIQYDQ